MLKRPWKLSKDGAICFLLPLARDFSRNVVELKMDDNNGTEKRSSSNCDNLLCISQALVVLQNRCKNRRNL